MGYHPRLWVNAHAVARDRMGEMSGPFP